MYMSIPTPPKTASVSFDDDASTREYYFVDRKPKLYGFPVGSTSLSRSDSVMQGTRDEAALITKSQRAA